MQRIGYRRPAFWPWLSLLAVSVGVIAVIAWDVWPWTAETLFARPRSNGQAPPSVPKADETMRVRLFFPQEAKGVLIEEEREIPRRSAFSNNVRAVLAELTKAGGTEGRSPLPPEVELHQVFLDAFGILYLDFDKRIQALAGGDGIRTDLATSSIVITLATNFSDVKRVQFLSEGEELTLLTGGVDLRSPLQPHFPDEETQSVDSQPREAE